jgi:hypothetical protein
MMNKKKCIALVIGMLMISLFVSTASAQDTIGATVVTGKEYTCYFYTPLDIFSGEVTFKPNGALSISSFNGYGFYLPIADLFTGAYWALDGTIGLKKGDVIMLLAGTSTVTLVAGTGILIFEYSAVYLMGFSGFLTELG